MREELPNRKDRSRVKWVQEREEDWLRLQKLWVEIRQIKDKKALMKEKKKKKQKEKKPNKPKKESPTLKFKQIMRVNLNPQKLTHIC